VLGIDAEVNPVIGKKLRRGIYASDRIHSLVMGFPGSGKTRFLLSMIKQRIDHGEGFIWCWTLVVILHQVFLLVL
jgi:primosomal protein N'